MYHMTRQALDAWAIVTYWDGQTVEDASGNQLQDINKQQGI